MMDKPDTNITIAGEEYEFVAFRQAAPGDYFIGALGHMDRWPGDASHNTLLDYPIYRPARRCYQVGALRLQETGEAPRQLIVGEFGVSLTCRIIFQSHPSGFRERYTPLQIISTGLTPGV